MDLGIIGTIIAIVIVVIIVISLRALREKYVWMDGIVAFIILGAAIVSWIIFGFWMGVATFLGSSGIAYILLGWGKEQIGLQRLRTHKGFLWLKEKTKS